MNSYHPESHELPTEWARAYRADRADPETLLLAYRRFVARRACRRRELIPRWAFVMSILGASATAAYAATGVFLQLQRSGPAPTSTVQPDQRLVAAGSRRIGSAAENSVRAVLPGTIPTAQEAASEAARASGTAGPTAAEAATAPRPFPSRPPNGQRPKPNRASSPPAAVESAWERAARGMRQNDYESANLALAEIEANATEREREAASLSRAQLLIARGQRIQAILLLRELSRNTKAAHVRTKSEELLSRLESANAP